MFTENILSESENILSESKNILSEYVLPVLAKKSG